MLSALMNNRKHNIVKKIENDFKSILCSVKENLNSDMVKLLSNKTKKSKKKVEMINL